MSNKLAIGNKTGALFLSTLVSLSPYLLLPCLLFPYLLSSCRLFAVPACAQGTPGRKVAPAAVLPDGQAVAGVKLIEDILSHVRSAPQLAMAPKKQDNDAVLAKDKGGPTDYRLAIRPREMSRRATAPQTPTLSLLPASADKVDNTAPPPVIAMPPAPQPASSPAAQGYGSPYGGAGATGLHLREKKQQRARAEMPQPDMSERWLGNQLSRETSPLVRSFEQSEQQLALAEKKPGIWEREQLQEKELILQGNAAAGGNISAEKNAEPLSFNEGLSSGASGVIPAAKLPAPVPGSFGPGGSASFGTVPVGSLGGRGAPSLLADASKMKTLSPSRSQRLDLPLDSLSDLRSGGKRESSAGAGGGYGTGNLTGVYKGLPVRKLVDERPGRQELIALLPPNVATGIPLVRLGAQQTQVAQSLKELGEMRSQQVNGWTVLSWYRSASPDKPALALYIKHGIVNAMRIFDASLISADFGVNLGQDLDCVKEKFGEPSFILSEPLPGTGKNYVYPISQIAFQLYRSRTHASPKVASILIFNVK